MLNCSNCPDNIVPETNSNYIPAPLNGCEDTFPSSCILFDGNNLTCITVTSGDSLTSVLEKLYIYANSLLDITSSSLVVTTPTGCATSTTIELVPSTDAGNVLILGDDGYPYVPTPSGGSDNIYNTNGTLTANRTLDGNEGQYSLTFQNLAGFSVVTDNQLQLFSDNADVYLQAESYIQLSANTFINLIMNQELQINGAPGNSAQYLKSTGSGTAPVWASLMSQNGLNTAVNGNIKLGGDLIEDTVIINNGNDLSIANANNVTTTFYNDVTASWGSGTMNTGMAIVTSDTTWPAIFFSNSSYPTGGYLMWNSNKFIGTDLATGIASGTGKYYAGTGYSSSQYLFVDSYQFSLHAIPWNNVSKIGLSFDQPSITPFDNLVGKLLSFTGTITSTAANTLYGLYTAITDNSVAQANLIYGVYSDVDMSGSNISAIKYSGYFNGGAVVLPNMTKTVRNTMTTAGMNHVGSAVYQTDNTPGLRVYNGTHWVRYTETNDD